MVESSGKGQRVDLGLRLFFVKTVMKFTLGGDSEVWSPSSFLLVLFCFYLQAFFFDFFSQSAVPVSNLPKDVQTTMTGLL